MVSEAAAGAGFTVDLEGFTGPLDLLLELARAEKVDLKRISLVALADQYLAYLMAARDAQLEIAADYLVMAAWLAYLKSQLLLPLGDRQEPDAEAMARLLTDRLCQLEGIRKAVRWLEQRPRLGRDRLPRGPATMPEYRVEPRWTASLAQLLSAYGVAASRRAATVVRLPRRRLFGVDAALQRLSLLLTGHEWRDLRAFLPPGLLPGIEQKAAVAASLLAGLELARNGTIELQQAAPFAPVMVRRRP